MIGTHKGTIFIVILFIIFSSKVIYSTENKISFFSLTQKLTIETETNPRFSKYFEDNFGDFFEHYFKNVDSINVYDSYIETCTENNTCNKYGLDWDMYYLGQGTSIEKTNRNWVAKIPVKEKDEITYKNFEYKMTTKLCEIVRFKTHKLYKNFTWEKESNISFQEWVKNKEKINDNFSNTYSTCLNYENIDTIYIYKHY